MNIRATLKVWGGAALFSFILLLAGCSKEKPASTANQNNNSNSLYYLEGLLGGKSITIMGPSNPAVDTNLVYFDSTGRQISQQLGIHDSSATWMSQYSTNASWVSATTNSNNAIVLASIKILKKLSVRVYVAPFPAPASNTLYSLLTQTQPQQSLTIADNNNPNDGVIVTIRDANGVTWSSLGQQSGSSSFTINARGYNMGTYAIISGTMNLTMYDGQGHSEQLTSTAYSAMMGL